MGIVCMKYFDGMNNFLYLMSHEDICWKIMILFNIFHYGLCGLVCVVCNYMYSIFVVCGMF